MTFVGLPVLWDLDGTLVDSGGDIADAMDRALVLQGLPPLGESRVRAHIGSGAQHLVTACARDAGGDFSPALLADFFATYQEHVADRTVLFAGVHDLLEGLHSRGIAQAIVTNKPVGICTALLKALGIEHYFSCVLGGESLPKRKPDPMMLYAAMKALNTERAVMIGDGPHDVGAARAAGLPIIGVDWGIATPVGADVRVQTVAQLSALLLPADTPENPQTTLRSEP